jgi:UDP-N-acetylglucosamine--N-acetylmuramyl-(pentapeptide) pyrophosphoryl-undecaprenol N-acetylglucosamine transferase
MHRPTVVFAGGGTGGHLFPALAVARSLPSVDSVFLVPPDRGDEGRLGGEFRCVAFSSPRIRPRPLLYAGKLALAVRRARRILRDLDADAVVGLGGYASVPAGVAARTLGLPLYLMEFNAVPGRANLLLSRYAAGIGLGSGGARSRFRARANCQVTGTPLRGELRARGRHEDFGLAPGRPTLLVLGGSQGAMGLNTRVLAGLPACRGRDFQVLHCAGQRDAARVRATYLELGLDACVLDFLPEIGRAYAVADLVLGRAGASTVAECAALGLPAVYVPYPWHRDRQQTANAVDAARAGAARIVEESDLDPAAVQEIVQGILLDEKTRARMAAAAAGLGRPEAARTMAAHLLESLGEALAEPRCMVELGE